MNGHAIRVRYEAPPTISAFQDSDAFVRIVMGPVGSGKSSGCVLEILRRAREQTSGPDGIRRTRFAIVRNTYRELEDTTRKTFETWIPDALGAWSEQDFSFHMRFSDIDCEILFRALDRPRDVKKLLSLELTGCYFNEMREIAKLVFEGMQGRVGRYPAKKDGGATWFGVWADTNPWHTGHWLAKLFRAKPTGHELFRQPGGRSPEAENVENLPPGYYERLCHGKPSDWVRVYVDGEEASSDIGSIYGDLLDGLDKRGGIGDFTHEMEGVFTAWDLGISDSTAIWWWRVHDGGAEFIDHYEAHGQPLSHFFDVVDDRATQRSYKYVKHWLPHDARARTLATGSTIYEQCADRWGTGRVDIVPKVSLLDGIQATRWLLEQPTTRIHERCADGTESLREYRYEWDEDARSFSRRPLHNFASHSADAARYAAVVFRYSDAITRKPVPEPEKPVARDIASFTFTELMESPRPRGGRRI